MTNAGGQREAVSDTDLSQKKDEAYTRDLAGSDTDTNQLYVARTRINLGLAPAAVATPAQYVDGSSKDMAKGPRPWGCCLGLTPDDSAGGDGGLSILRTIKSPCSGAVIEIFQGMADVYRKGRVPAAGAGAAPAEVIARLNVARKIIDSRERNPSIPEKAEGDEQPQKEDPWLERVRVSARKRAEKPGVLSLVFKASEVEASSYGQEANGQIADASGRVIGAFDDFALFKQDRKPIERRIEDGELAYRPNSYLPEIGDVYGLFYRLLLSNMPLNRVGTVWSDKARGLQQPRSTEPVQFHKNYMGQWHTVLGDAPSLLELRSFTDGFLTTKCAPDKVAEAKANPERAYNDFKWKGFYMSHDEIDATCKRTIYQYGLARMKHGWEEDE